MGWLSNQWRNKARGEWAWYEDLSSAIPNGQTLIQEAPFVVLDLETTGLNPAKDRILSLAAIQVVGSEIRIDRMMDVQIPQAYFDARSIPIHEIMPGGGQITSGLAEHEVLEAFLRMAAGSVWVGHFCEIDRGFLEALSMRIGGFGLLNPFVDTAKLLPRATDYYRDEVAMKPGAWKLEAVCRHFDLPLDDVHTAAGDTLATALLFVKLSRLLEKRGVRKLKDIIG
jgi:DNA polymerase-3 subunit epsilon